MNSCKVWIKYSAPLNPNVLFNDKYSLKKYPFNDTYLHLFIFLFFDLETTFFTSILLARHFPSFNSQFISPQVGNIFSQTACLLPIKWTFSKWNDPCAPVLVQIMLPSPSPCTAGDVLAKWPFKYYVSRFLDIFWPTHLLCKHDLCTERKQKWQFSGPTHPDLCLRNIWMVPKRKERKKACYRMMAAS